MINVFLTNTHLLASQDVIVGLVWIIVMFLSAVWTLNLTAPIHCRGWCIGEQVMQCCISSNLMKKQTHLYLGWPEGEHIFILLISLGYSLLNNQFESAFQVSFFVVFFQWGFDGFIMHLSPKWHKPVTLYVGQMAFFLTRLCAASLDCLWQHEIWRLVWVSTRMTADRCPDILSYPSDCPTSAYCACAHQYCILSLTLNNNI